MEVDFVAQGRGRNASFQFGLLEIHNLLVFLSDSEK